jgi:hypothetical protein
MLWYTQCGVSSYPSEEQPPDLLEREAVIMSRDSTRLLFPSASNPSLRPGRKYKAAPGTASPFLGQGLPQ